MSPCLSNIYLSSFDGYMEEKGYNWIRFADNIYVYIASEEAGISIYKELTEMLIGKYGLPINEGKSGIFDAFDRRLLGYDIFKKGKHVHVEKHSYQRNEYYRNWHECKIEKINREYHITKSGILNKKDYALLFENENERHHIPVEATEQIDIYNDVTITNAVFRTLSNEAVRLGIYNKHGDLLSTSLDSRIGIFHSANKRHYSLNLDFADLFKPIIVDRVIFTLINRKQIGNKHFVVNDDNSVYLNEEGKRLFVESFIEKLNSKLTHEEKSIKYHQL